MRPWHRSNARADTQPVDQLSEVDRRREPWFRWHPFLACLIAAVLYAGLFLLGWSGVSRRDPVTVLYVLPVALLAVSFGRRVGIVAAVAGATLTVTWALMAGVSLSTLGWLARLTPILLVGVLLGDAAERARTGSDAELELFATRLRQREAAEINDSILQHLTVAKWALEGGDHERAAELLAETMMTGQRLVNDLLAASAGGLGAGCHQPGGVGPLLGASQRGRCKLRWR